VQLSCLLRNCIRLTVFGGIFSDCLKARDFIESKSEEEVAVKAWQVMIHEVRVELNPNMCAILNENKNALCPTEFPFFTDFTKIDLLVYTHTHAHTRARTHTHQGLARR
jgi:hypothetical protein